MYFQAQELMLGEKKSKKILKAHALQWKMLDCSCFFTWSIFSNETAEVQF